MRKSSNSIQVGSAMFLQSIVSIAAQQVTDFYTSGFNKLSSALLLGIFYLRKVAKTQNRVHEKKIVKIRFIGLDAIRCAAATVRATTKPKRIHANYLLAGILCENLQEIVILSRSTNRCHSYFCSSTNTLGTARHYWPYCWQGFWLGHWR